MKAVSEIRPTGVILWDVLMRWDDVMRMGNECV